MKIKKLIASLLFMLALSACTYAPPDTGKGFELSAFGQSFATENAVFCMENGALSLYSANCEKILTEPQNMAEPKWNFSGSYAVIYDCGGNEIISSNGKTVDHNNINNKIMSTEINRNGYIAVCAEEEGCKGAVTVYGTDFEPLYKWYCVSGYIIKAALSEKNTLAVLTANEEGSTAHVFALDSEKEQYSVTMPRELAIDVFFVDGRLCMLSEKALYFAEKDKIRNTVSFDRELGEYAAAEDYILLELRSGDGSSELCAYGGDGKLRGSAGCELLRDIAVSDKKIAVISGGEVIAFDAKLAETFRGDAKGVRNIMLCGDRVLLQRDSEIIAINDF